MLGYVIRRLAMAVVILFASSYLVYMLAAYAGDPLEDLRQSRDPNRDALIAQRTAALNLDVPPPLRYFLWLRGAIGCVAPFIGTCDLGTNLQGFEVTDLLARAIAQTVLLVTAATVLSIVIGIALGIVSALRQYSGLDYGITFMAFLFFSLPVFWVAVLLKEFGAIRFNDFLRDPTFSLTAILFVGIVVALVAYGTAYGATRTKVLVAAAAAVVVMGLMLGLSASGWLVAPFLGIPGILVVGGLIAVALTFLMSGLRNRRALYSGLTAVLVAAIAYFPIQPVLGDDISWLLVFGLGLVTIAVGAAIGYAYGGYDRGQSMRVGAASAFFAGGLVLLDRFMQSWPQYVGHGRIRGRPISTVGSSTPGFNEGFWLTGLDTMTHLILPTAALMLVALAGYSRYSRASMLEIMNMDYIRTARAKGASERSVVMKHAFRNALIPLATLIAFDIGGLIGGAVITENVFAFTGMGQLFIQALGIVDLNPLMGVFLVTGLLAMVFNLIADLLYSVLDPRVRVKA
jgi:peptide/nickel transport system permease protein